MEDYLVKRIEDVIYSHLEDLYKTDFYYNRKVKAKKRERILIIPEEKPMKKLKWMAKFIDNCYTHSEHSHGGVKGRSSKTSAEPHRRSKYWMTADMKRAFYQIKSKVKTMLENHGFSSEFINLMRSVLTPNGYLPQGFPTSNILFNMTMDHFDTEKMKLQNYSDVLTRFSDNYAFSWLDKPGNEKEIRKRFNDYGINIRSKGIKNIEEEGISLSGVVLVPDGSKKHKLILPRKLRKKIRGMKNKHTKNPESKSENVLNAIDILEKGYNKITSYQEHLFPED